jgi:hypothetical protein
LRFGGCLACFARPKVGGEGLLHEQVFAALAADDHAGLASIPFQRD